LSIVEPRLFELELKITPLWSPEMDSMVTGEDAVPSIETLPSTPRRSPSPRRIDVPAWMTRTWLDCTRYPSGSEIVPLQTVVDRVRPADVPDKIGASRSIRTSETAKRMGNAIRNQG